MKRMVSSVMSKLNSTNFANYNILHKSYSAQDQVCTCKFMYLSETMLLSGASTARVGQQVFFAEANIMMTFFGIFNQKAYYLDRAGVIK